MSTIFQKCFVNKIEVVRKLVSQYVIIVIIKTLLKLFLIIVLTKIIFTVKLLVILNALYLRNAMIKFNKKKLWKTFIQNYYRLSLKKNFYSCLYRVFKNKLLTKIIKAANILFFQHPVSPNLLEKTVPLELEADILNENDFFMVNILKCINPNTGLK